MTCSKGINDLHLQPQTEKWRALQRAISLAARLLGFCLRWPWSSVAAWLTGATGAATLCCSISAQFPGIAQFSTRCLTSFLAALHVSAAHCALNTASHRRRFSHHRDTSEQTFVPKSAALYNQGAERTLK